MFLIRLYLFVYVNLFLYVKCSIPVEKLCVTPACKEPISKAQGSVKYTPHTRELLGFNRGQEITITSKSKNVNDYWGAIIDGRSGYVPSHLIKEVKVFHRADDLITVPVEVMKQTSSVKDAKPLENSTLDQILANKDETKKSNIPHLSESVVGVPDSENSNVVQKPVNPNESFKIIEGTTIYSDETNEITPSPTVNVKSPQTVAPGNNNKKESAQERATIPLEIMNLNNNYEMQNLEIQNSFSVENVKENDENAKIESKDIYADEDEGDEEDENEGEGEGEGEDEGEDEEDDEEDAINDNIVTESELDKKKDTSSAGVTEPNKDSENEKAEVIASITQAVFTGIEESAIENEVNAAENPKNQVSPNIGNDKVAPSVEQQPEITLPPFNHQNSDNVKVKMPTQGVPSSWNELDDFKESSQISGADVNTPSKPLGSSFDVKYEIPETVTSKFGKVLLPDAPPSEIAFHQIAAQIKSENFAEAVTETVTEAPSKVTPQMVQQIKNIPSAETSQVLPNSDSQVPNAVTLEVIKEMTTVAAARSSQPNIQETSTVFSQFSVSADALSTENKNAKKPSVIPEMMQKKAEGESEAFTIPAPLAVDSAKLFSAPQVSSMPKIATSKINQEKVEVTTEASISPSVLPEVQTEGSSQESFPKFIENTKITEQLSEDFSASSENKIEEPELLSQISGTLLSWFSSSSEKGLPNEKEAKSSGKVTEAPLETCHNSELSVDCNDFASAEKQISFWSGLKFSLWNPADFGLDNIVTQSNTLLYLIVTAVTVLLFTLGHNFIEKRGKTGPLIAKINNLEHELLVTSKECLLFKDEVQSLREKITLYENSANDELVVSLQAELEESKKVRSELESTIEVLQQELDAATEAGLDLNKMLSEVLTQKGGSETLLKSVESLQAQLDSQQKVIDEMTKKLGVKNQENEALQMALEAANEKSENLEEELSDMKHNLNLHLKEKDDLTQDLNSQISELNTRISQLGETKEKEASYLKKELVELQKKLSEISSALTVKEEEVKALKDSMKHLKAKGDVKLETVFDVSLVKAELAKEVKQNQVLVEKLKEEEVCKKALAEQVKVLNSEVQQLRNGYEEAVQKKEEAEKKLEVLSAYFKEKETQLQKELGLQEALWAQKKGDEKAVYNMMKSLQEEVESYKSQNETLKKEILDQERGLKNQIASLEQKAYENWVAARQAERKLEESKQEMAQLRNRLTLIEKNSNSIEAKGNLRSSEELNGVEAVSPILNDTSSPLMFPPFPLDPNNSNLLPPSFMPPPIFMPPPMGGFIPPPPFLPGDRRPPPLGRMSSPPLNNRFSPSSPADYPFERMSSPPLSLPGSNYRSPNEDREHYRHKTPPYPSPLNPKNWDDNNEMPGFISISSQRDSRRDHKGSNVSSEHSSSESLDKSSRHSGRV